MKIYESTFYSFELSEKTMIVRWKDNTDQMSYQDFKDALMNFAGYVIEHQALKVLIFAENFKFRQPEEEAEWRKNVYNTRIKKVGEVKQALVMPKEFLQYVEDEIGSKALVQVRYFASESEATAWLDSSE
ncbi:MAG: STAS/SEC14 domain-containing protein [bacterium]|nr:STAS/SEC14 domain-containing protein [bacterium]